MAARRPFVLCWIACKLSDWYGAWLTASMCGRFATREVDRVTRALKLFWQRFNAPMAVRFGHAATLRLQPAN